MRRSLPFGVAEPLHDLILVGIDLNPVPGFHPVCDSLLDESMADLVGIERAELACVEAFQYLSPTSLPFP
ncbi:MAG: hypothetical protein ACJ746_22560 [Bryobacteraceae bacterium]